MNTLTDALWTLYWLARLLLEIALDEAALLRKRVWAAIQRRGTAHDRTWRKHPAVATDGTLTFGQRAADLMKSVFATWTALLTILLFMAVWIKTGGFGHDGFPYILLNLCLSCLAALQCFILLIAAKRDDQISAAIALHTLENTEKLAQLIAQNTTLTEQVATLTQQVAAHVVPAVPVTSAPTAPDPEQETQFALPAIRPAHPAETARASSTLPGTRRRRHGSDTGAR